jgi:hypothetical protein
MSKATKSSTNKNTKTINELTEQIMSEVKPDAATAEQTTPTSEPKVEVIQEIKEDSTFGAFNPLEENVIQRDYSNPPVDTQLTSDIDEPVFVPPSYDQVVERDNEFYGGGGAEPENPFVNPNPAVNQLDEKDQQIACEMLVDTMLEGYEQLHEIGKYVAKADEAELVEKQMQGKLDLSTQRVPISEDGSSVTLGEFVQTYNGQVDEALTYDKEFGKKVRPAMVRLFTKNGWGMSDGQYLGFMFGKDLVTKAAMIYQMKKAFGFTIEMMEKQFKAERTNEQPAQNYEEPRQQQRQRPQPAPQQQEEYIPTFPTEDVSVEEIAAMKKNRKGPGRPKKDASVQSMKIDYPNRVKTDPIPKEVRDGM